ncbi:MAG TPA: alpha/beta fold hydrolase [Gammaproteobacteria bacterium]|nr:alpha/beta fold hydrolase [Gammaproteobacteria bacterium]
MDAGIRRYDGDPGLHSLPLTGVLPPMTDYLPAIEIDPPTSPTASVIWLHGLGASGHDFEGLVPELGLVEQGVRFVLPHAPELPVTINQGYVMPAWYDVVGLDLTAHQDAAGIQRSAGRVADLLVREIERGVPARRILLAGFSQGGAVALHTALRYPQRLAGVLALSTYLPLADTVAKEMDAVQQGLPVFFGHGDRDEVIPLPVGARSRDRLEDLGCVVEWHGYPMAHSVCMEEVADIRAWLTQRLI